MPGPRGFPQTAPYSTDPLVRAMVAMAGQKQRRQLVEQQMLLQSMGQLGGAFAEQNKRGDVKAEADTKRDFAAGQAELGRTHDLGKQRITEGGLSARAEDRNELLSGQAAERNAQPVHSERILGNLTTYHEGDAIKARETYDAWKQGKVTNQDFYRMARGRPMSAAEEADEARKGLAVKRSEEGMDLRRKGFALDEEQHGLAVKREERAVKTQADIQENRVAKRGMEMKRLNQGQGWLTLARKKAANLLATKDRELTETELRSLRSLRSKAAEEYRRLIQAQDSLFTEELYAPMQALTQGASSFLGELDERLNATAVPAAQAARADATNRVESADAAAAGEGQSLLGEPFFAAFRGLNAKSGGSGSQAQIGQREDTVRKLFSSGNMDDTSTKLRKIYLDAIVAVADGNDPKEVFQEVMSNRNNPRWLRTMFHGQMANVPDDEVLATAAKDPRFDATTIRLLLQTVAGAQQEQEK